MIHCHMTVLQIVKAMWLRSRLCVWRAAHV